MNNKIIFSIGLLLISLLCISVTFANDDYKTTDTLGELESRDYGEFVMDTPSKITFQESDDGAYNSHVFYNKNFMCVYIYDKDKCDPDTAYNYHTSESKVIYPDTVSDNDKSGKCTFYKEKHSPYLNNYIASYENEDYVIIIRYDYIDDLVDMTRTIDMN